MKSFNKNTPFVENIYEDFRQSLIDNDANTAECIIKAAEYLGLTSIANDLEEEYEQYQDEQTALYGPDDFTNKDSYDV